MIETITIARPYAKAAFEAAKAKDSMESWTNFFELMSVIAENADMRALLINPQMNNEAILSFMNGVVAEVLKDGCTEEVRNFLVLLADNGRFNIVSDICKQFLVYRDDYLGIKNAQIVSALTLNEAQVNALAKALEKHYACQIRAKVAVDPTLIGGVRIAVGDQVIDASVRGQLDRMAAALTQ